MLRLLLSTLLLVLTLQSRAQYDVNRKLVLGTIDRFFAAMTTRDTAAMSATMLRGGSMHIASLFGGEDARVVSFQAYLTKLAKGKERLVERYWDADVDMIGESMATVVMEYEFHVDGRFSHCGTDLFVLVKGPGGWRIASITYTRMEGCRDSPIPPIDH